MQYHLGLLLLCDAYQAPFNLLGFISENDCRRAFDTVEWCSSGLEVAADTEQKYVIDKLYSQRGLPCDYTIITPLTVACCVRNGGAIIRLVSELRNQGFHKVCYLLDVRTNWITHPIHEDSPIISGFGPVLENAFPLQIENL